MNKTLSLDFLRNNIINSESIINERRDMTNKSRLRIKFALKCFQGFKQSMHFSKEFQSQCLFLVNRKGAKKLVLCLDFYSVSTTMQGITPSLTKWEASWIKQRNGKSCAKDKTRQDKTKRKTFFFLSFEFQDWLQLYYSQREWYKSTA